MKFLEFFFFGRLLTTYLFMMILRSEKYKSSISLGKMQSQQFCGVHTYLIKIMFTKVCRSYHSTLANQTFHQTKSFIEN